MTKTFRKDIAKEQIFSDSSKYFHRKVRGRGRLGRILLPLLSSWPRLPHFFLFFLWYVLETFYFCPVLLLKRILNAGAAMPECRSGWVGHIF